MIMINHYKAPSDVQNVHDSWLIIPWGLALFCHVLGHRCERCCSAIYGRDYAVLQRVEEGCDAIYGRDYAVLESGVMARARAHMMSPGASELKESVTES